MIKLRDRVVLGLAAGMLGNLAKDGLDYLAYKKGWSELLYGHLAASLFAEPEKVRQPKDFVVGQLVDMTWGALSGVPVVYLLSWTGRDHYLLKGAAMGVLWWQVVYGLFPRLRMLQVDPQETETNLSALLNHLAYGLVTSAAAVHLGHPDLFPAQTGNPGDDRQQEAAKGRTGPARRRGLAQTLGSYVQ